jgi:tetratricopeptide (TPR) repeat protein
MKHWTVSVIVLVPLVLMIASTLLAQGPTATTQPSPKTTVAASRRQLNRQWQATPEDKKKSSGLQDAIKRLRTVMNQPKSVTEPQIRPTTPPTRIKIPTTQPTTQPKTVTAKAPKKTVDPRQIGDRLRKLNKIEDPTAVGDALFQGKRLDLAAIIYDRAVKGNPASEQKAWLMFQAANCRRKTDPQKAVKTYDALVAAHPDSLWSSIALVQKDIVAWQSTNNLENLLKDAGKKGQQSADSSERK